MYNKKKNYSENNNPAYYSLSKLNWDSNLKANFFPTFFSERFMYRRTVAAFFPENASYLQTFTFNGTSYCHTSGGLWVIVTLPLVFPTVTALPKTAKHLEVFTVGDKSFVWQDRVTYGKDLSKVSGNDMDAFVPVTLPFSFPSDRSDYVNNNRTWVYNTGLGWYTGGPYFYETIPSVQSVLVWSQAKQEWVYSGSGVAGFGLNYYRYTLTHYLEKYREMGPVGDTGTNGVRMLTDPVFTPIEKYNEDRLLGTITSAQIQSTGFNFPQEIASQLPDAASIMLVPVQLNPPNTLGAPVSSEWVTQVTNTYSGSKGYSTKPFYSTPFNNTNAPFTYALSYAFYVGDAKFTDVGGDFYTQGRGTCTFQVQRAGTSNLWELGKTIYRRTLGINFQRLEGNTGTVGNSGNNNTAGVSYPFPWFGEGGSERLTVFSDPGQNITYNVYLSSYYKEMPDGTEVYLRTGKSPYQTYNNQSPINYWSTNEYAKSVTSYGAKSGYWNLAFLNEGFVNKTTGEITTQGADFGVLPDGTRVQLYGAYAEPNIWIEYAAYIFTENLTPQQRTGWDEVKTKLKKDTMHGSFVFLLGQTNPLENGLWQVLCTPTNNIWYRLQTLTNNNLNYGYGARPVTASAFWQSKGEVSSSLNSNLYVFGYTGENLEVVAYKFTPPYDQNNYYSISPRVGFPNKQKLELTPKQTERLKRGFEDGGLYSSYYGTLNVTPCIFSELPSGIVEGEVYYSIKEGNKLRLAKTYKDALEKKAITFEDVGVGAVAVYTAQADENESHYRLDINPDTGVEEKTELDPNKIYYLINKKWGFQLADTKEKALAKQPIKLEMAPNVYMELEKNLDPPTRAPRAWKPDSTALDVFNPKRSLPMTGGNLRIGDLFVYNSGLVNNNYYYYNEYGYGQYVNPCYPFVDERGRKYLIQSGQLSGLYRGYSGSAYEEYQLGSPFVRTNYSNFYNNNQLPWPEIGTGYIEGVSSGITANPVLPATYTCLGVTLTQKAIKPQDYLQFINQGVFGPGYYQWNPLELSVNFLNFPAFSSAVAALLNQTLENTVIELDRPSFYGATGYYDADTGSVFSLNNKIVLSLPVTGSYSTGVWRHQISAPNPQPIEWRSNTRYINENLNLSTGYSVSYNPLTQQVKLVMGPVGYAVFNGDTNTLIYNRVGSSGLNFALQSSQQALNVPKTLTLSLGAYFFYEDKSLKLTFSNLKHIWKKFTLQSEVLTRSLFQNTQYMTDINEAIEGVDFEETAGDFPSEIVCPFDFQQGAFCSPPLISNGVKFKIQAHVQSSTGFLLEKFYGTPQFTLRIKGSPNTSLDIAIGMKITQVTNTTGLVTTTREKAQYVINFDNTSANNGSQLAILDPLWRTPRNKTNAYDLPIIPYYLEYRSLGNKYPSEVWGVITRVNVQGAYYQTLKFKTYPVLTEVISATSAIVGSGAKFKMTVSSYLSVWDGDPAQAMRTTYKVDLVEILDGGKRYLAGDKIGIVGKLATMADTNSTTYLILGTNYPPGTATSFPSTAVIPTEAQIRAAFLVPVSPYYPAPTLGLDGKRYLPQAQGPVSIGYLTKIELI